MQKIFSANHTKTNSSERFVRASETSFTKECKINLQKVVSHDFKENISSDCIEQWMDLKNDSFSIPAAKTVKKEEPINKLLNHEESLTSLPWKKQSSKEVHMILDKFYSF